MYESGQSGLLAREEILRMLRRLEDALAAHEQMLAADAGTAGSDARLNAVQRSLRLMYEEAERLRGLLRAFAG